MHENKNEQNTGTKTIKKIGKATYEVIVHFNENAAETMQDKLKRIMLREMESIQMQQLFQVSKFRYPSFGIQVLTKNDIFNADAYGGKQSSRYMQLLSWAHGKIEPDTKTVSITKITLGDMHGLCWTGVCAYTEMQLPYLIQ